MSVLSHLAARPERALWALIAAQIVFWTLAPTLSHSSPPVDVIEVYVFGRVHEVAVFKHPNLSGLILEASRILTGAVGWPAYLISQVFIAATFWAVFQLGRDLMDARRALAGTLLLAGVFFFSWPTPEFNHNVVQMPFWALTCLFLWRATTHGKWLDWALLGFFGGFSLWTKYSAAILLVAAVAWILFDARARRTLLTAKPYLALVLFAAIAAPQALWLFESNGAPLRYAADRADHGGLLNILEFLLTGLVAHLPFLIMLAAAGWFGKSEAQENEPADRRAIAFLLIMALGPIALSVIAGLVAGMGLKTEWATTMFNLSGLLVVALLTRNVTNPRVARLVNAAAVLLVALPALYFTYVSYGAEIRHKPQRTNYPQAAISARMSDIWRNSTDAPLRIVGGDQFVAGMIGLSDRHPPLVLINGDYETSPWVTPQDAQRDGMLIVWPAERRVSETVAALIAGRDVGSESFRYPVTADLPPLELNYVIIPPQR